MEESLEKKLQLRLSKAGFDVSRTELRDLVREYNQYYMPIKKRLQDIINSPGEFLEFLRRKNALS